MRARTRGSWNAVDIETAFSNRVKKTSGCWLWPGAPYGGGYGQFNYANKRYYAHVFSLKLDGRPVPKSQRGLHHCDNKLCVKPSHLYIGTQRNNMEDTWNRSRTDYGVQHWAAKLNPEAVLEMRRQRLLGVSFAQIARAFNISIGTAFSAIRGRTWKRSVPSNADDLARLKRVQR